MRRHKTVARRKVQGFGNSALENTVVNISYVGPGLTLNSALCRRIVFIYFV